MNPKPETDGSAAGSAADRRVGTDAAAATAVAAAAAGKRAVVVVADAACQLVGLAEQSGVYRGLLEDVATQAGAVMQSEWGVLAADGNLELAAAETATGLGIVADTGYPEGGCPAAIDLEVAEKLAVVDTGSSCAVAVRYPGRVAERLQVEGLVLIVGQKACRRPKLEADGQSAGTLDIAAGLHAVVVAALDVGWGCSALPRLASGSYLRCLPCQAGADCTGPGASS